MISFMCGIFLVPKKKVGEAIHTHQWQRASREDDELQAAKRTPSGTEEPVSWWLQ